MTAPISLAQLLPTKAASMAEISRLPQGKNQIRLRGKFRKKNSNKNRDPISAILSHHTVQSIEVSRFHVVHSNFHGKRC